jgi:hypothetical protein
MELTKPRNSSSASALALGWGCGIENDDRYPGTIQVKLSLLEIIILLKRG